MEAMKTEESIQKPTKKFLLDQIRSCEMAILQNQGAINLCQNMLKNNIFIDDDKIKEELPK